MLSTLPKITMQELG